MNSTPARQQATDDHSLSPTRHVRHRLLTPDEVQAIWALLNPVSLPDNTQEVHITLRQDTEAPHSGWIIQVVQPS
jgi:hypothetical protein